MCGMREQADERARRLLRVFGDVLPESCTDERPDDADKLSQDRERWLRDNRPPHHERPDGPL